MQKKDFFGANKSIRYNFISATNDFVTQICCEFSFYLEV